MTVVLAIDQGTSATKAVVADASGPLVDIDVPVTGTLYDDPRVEQDPIALLDSVISAGRAALAQWGRPVEGAGLGNQGETVLAWDLRTGDPLGPALSWQDRRSSSITEAMPTSDADRLLRLTGLPLDPYFAAPKMAWLRRTLGDTCGPDIAITTIDAWTTYRLTGEFVTDVATASRTMLLDPHRLDWSSEALEAFGLQGLPQPRVIACDAPIGATDAFGQRIPVVGAIVDQQASLLAENCRTAGSAKCTYGTGAFLLANVGPAHEASRSGLATSIAWAFQDGTRASCVDGQVYTVGAAVGWLQRIGLIASPDDLDALGGSVADTTGVMCLPSLAGVGAPMWLPDARGRWSGLSLATTRAHLVRSFCEGVAAQVAVLADAVSHDAGHSIGELRVDGGITRSRTIMQMQADLLGAPVEVYPHPCATALGIAALTLRGLAGAAAAEPLIADWQPSATYLPRADPDVSRARVAQYAEALARSTP